MAATFALAACTGAPEGLDESVSPSVVAPTPSDVQSQADHVHAEEILPDPSIMATMTCEPVSDETLAYLGQVYAPPLMEPVQVLVGEGLSPGEDWWVIVTDLDRGPTGGNNQWLTNQPGLSGERGNWIGIGAETRAPDGTMRSSFDGVHWDYERLVKGRNALTKAFECLKST